MVKRRTRGSKRDATYRNACRGQESRQGGRDRRAVGDPAEQMIFPLNGRQGGLVQARIEGGAAVLQQETGETPVDRLAQGRLHAALRGHAAEQQEKIELDEDAAAAGRGD